MAGWRTWRIHAARFPHEGRATPPPRTTAIRPTITVRRTTSRGASAVRSSASSARLDGCGLLRASGLGRRSDDGVGFRRARVGREERARHGPLGRVAMGLDIG
jgi:hypothetical protein